MHVNLRPTPKTDSYCDPIQPPVDDNEYYEDVTDEELAEMNRHCMEYQKGMTEGKVEVTKEVTKEVTLEDSCDKNENVDETWTVEVEKEEDQEDHGDTDEDEDDNNHPQPLHPPAQPLPVSPQSPSQPHHNIRNNIITTSPPDICVPNPHPLAPNIWCTPTCPHHLCSERNPPRHCCTPAPPLEAEYTPHVLIADVRG
jgi:hypothetical protein